MSCRAELAAIFRESAPLVKCFRVCPLTGSGAAALEDHVGGLFRNHVYGADDEEAGDARKYRGVDHAEAGGAVHAEIAAEHAAVFDGSDGAGPAPMMSPRVAANVFFDLRVALDGAAGQHFAGADPV